MTPAEMNHLLNGVAFAFLAVLAVSAAGMVVYLLGRFMGWLVVRYWKD